MKIQAVDPPRSSLTLINLVIDQSGSMSFVSKGTIEGVNNLIRDQRSELGEAKLTMLLFDTDITLVHNHVDIKNVPFLNSDTYRPGGGTALFDAVGTSVAGTNAWLDDHAEFDGNIITVIWTDGAENSSRRWKQADVNSAIDKAQERCNWHFQFMGAGDGWRSAELFTSVPSGNRWFVNQDNSSYTASYAGLSASIGSLRNTGNWNG